MYALASLCRRRLRGRFGTWRAARGPLVSAALPVAFAWQVRHLVHCQGVGCTPWRPLVSAALPVAFAWQAQHLELCQGVGCTPWRPLVSAALPVAFAWQARQLVLWTLVSAARTAKGSDVRPPPLCRWRLRGRCEGLGALPRGRMYALASLVPRRPAYETSAMNVLLGGWGDAVRSASVLTSASCSDAQVDMSTWEDTWNYHRHRLKMYVLGGPL